MTTLYPINDGIPIPPPAYASHGHSSRKKYPVAELGVGQSFFVPDGNPNAFNGAVWYHVQKGKAFAVRTVVENGREGIRVWRVEPTTEKETAR